MTTEGAIVTVGLIIAIHSLTMVFCLRSITLVLERIASSLEARELGEIER